MESELDVELWIGLSTCALRWSGTHYFSLSESWTISCRIDFERLLLSSYSMLLLLLLLFLLEPSLSFGLLFDAFLLELCDVLLEFGDSAVAENGALLVLLLAWCGSSVSSFDEEWIELVDIFVFSEDFLIPEDFWFFVWFFITSKVVTF